jgi:hypothetical protein
MDVIVAVAAAALIGIIWSLWQRRITWGCRWERITTLSVGLQGVGLALASPLGNPLEYNLHDTFGLYGLPQLAGHLLILGATAAFAYTALSRALPASRLVARVPLILRWPGATAGSFLIVDYMVSDIPNYPGASIVTQHPDCAIAYSMVLCGTNLYLFMWASLALWLLRRSPRHRVIANLYLFACACGIVAATTWIAAQFVAGPFHVACYVACWVLFCLWGGAFTLAAAYSWRRKVQVFQPLLQAVRN